MKDKTYDPYFAIEKDNTINHKEYYGRDATYEAIKGEFGFTLGNVLKHVRRDGKKTETLDGKLIDMKKARDYLNFEIEELELLIEKGDETL